jgi:pimeloyl-ACP methyl ester carboxylesterase
MEGQERRFKINGLMLAACEWPGVGLPVIALHGWLDNAASFAPIAEHLSGYHLLALDLPGHGHSGHLPPGAYYHLADNLHWLAAVADEMGWPRFILLGHSMGSAIACLAAAAMPQRVIALSLIDGLGPIAFSPALEVRRLRQLFAGSRHARARRPFTDITVAARTRQKHSRFPISLEAARIIVERNLSLTAAGYYWCYDEHLQEPSSHYYCEEQVRGILHTIESPALLISAGEGALQGWQGFADRKAALPGLQHQVLPGGHHLHMETPIAVAGVLNHFYGTLDGDKS